jgi:molybdopterin converting factor small subunit
VSPSRAATAGSRSWFGHTGTRNHVGIVAPVERISPRSGPDRRSNGTSEPNTFGNTLRPLATLRSAMSTSADADRTVRETTTVQVRATGHLWTRLPEPRFAFEFEGSTLREFLDAFFAEYGCEDLLLAETDAEAATSGWAPRGTELPGNWNANPEGDRTRAYARILVNGKFNELLDGFDTELEDGDRVALVYPFVFCC